MATKKKDYEKLTNENIRRVKELLEADKPITKKEACEMLNISYNTTRLQRIIDEYTEIQQYAASRRAANRGKAASADEVSFIVSEYLKGSNISTIANQLYRSAGFVKGVIERVGVPRRDEETVRGVDILPEQCISDVFKKGQRAWSTLYHTLVEVGEELSLAYQESRKGMKPIDYENKYGCKAYQIYIIEDVDNESSWFPGVDVGGFSGYALACELGDLSHLESLGVKL